MLLVEVRIRGSRVVVVGADGWGGEVLRGSTAEAGREENGSTVEDGREV